MVVHRFSNRLPRWYTCRLAVSVLLLLALVNSCKTAEALYTRIFSVRFPSTRLSSRCHSPSLFFLKTAGLSPPRMAGVLSKSMSVSSTNTIHNESNTSNKASQDKEGRCRRLKLVLLDRDGVINQDVGSPGVIDPQQLVLTPGAGHAVGKFQRAGLKVAIITNQSCVGKRLINATELRSIHQRLQDLLLNEDPDAKWDELYESLTTTDVVDPRRKPAPGMILEACDDFGVSPAETVFVGDTLTDLQAAHAAGIPQRILVSTGYGTAIMEEAGYSVLPGGRQEEPRVVDSSGPVQKDQLGDSALQMPRSDNNNVKCSLEEVMPIVFVSDLRSASDWIMGQL